MTADELQVVGEMTKGEIGAHNAVDNLCIVEMLLQNGLEDVTGAGDIVLQQPGVRLQQVKFHVHGTARREIFGLVSQLIYQWTRPVNKPEPGVKIRQGEFRRGGGR